MAGTALKYIEQLGGSPTIVANYTPQQTAELAYYPTMRAVFDPSLPLIHANHNVLNGRWALTYLSDNGIAVQAGADACDSNPIGSTNVSQMILHTCTFKIQDEMCLRNALAACNTYWGGRELDSNNPTASQVGRAMLEAYWELKRLSVQNNIAASAWLGNVDYDLSDFDNACPLNIDPSDTEGVATFKKRALNFLSHCDGWFKHIQSDETMVGTDVLEQYHDMELPQSEGTVDDLVIGLFRSLKDGGTGGSKSQVRFIHNGAFYVTTSLYNSYYRHLTACYKGIIDGYRLMINGNTATYNGREVLLFEGKPVYLMCEWDQMLAEYFGYSHAHAVIYTRDKNLALGTNILSYQNATTNGQTMLPTNGYSGPMLRFYGGTGRDEGTVFMKGQYDMGTKIAIPRHLTSAFSFTLNTGV